MKLILLLLMIFLNGCISYKQPTSSFYQQLATSKPVCGEDLLLYEEYQEQALSHWLYDVIPRHRCQIRWYDLPHWITWGCFGNDDDGLFSELQFPLYRPQNQPSLFKAMAWTARNPLHNFCFYCIGTAAYQNNEFTLLKINRRQCCFMQYDPVAHTVFAGERSSFYCGFHNALPLISLRLAYGEKWKSDFYIGWREKGNFGIKFLPLTKNSLAVWQGVDY